MPPWGSMLKKDRTCRALAFTICFFAIMQGRIYALPDVWIRPAFGGKGRKVTGTLEAHANGFRYTSPKGEELDVLYR